MQKPALALLLTAVFTIACGQLDHSSRNSIYNGSIDTEHDSVGILILDGKLWCTASLIGNQTAISAAHCFDGRSSMPNDLYLQFSSTKVKVVEVVSHPKYSDWFGRVNNDVAVLHLEEILNIPAIPLASQSPITGQPAILVGFGYTDATLKSSMDGTKRTGFSYVGKVEKNRLFIPLPKDSSMSQTCKGDSGGPIFSEQNGQKSQIGLVSGSLDGRATKTCKIESYAARIDTYIEWIFTAARGDAIINHQPQ